MQQREVNNKKVSAKHSSQINAIKCAFREISNEQTLYLDHMERKVPKYE